jgi:hypothetical protein
LPDLFCSPQLLGCISGILWIAIGATILFCFADGVFLSVGDLLGFIIRRICLKSKVFILGGNFWFIRIFVFRLGGRCFRVSVC